MIGFVTSCFFTSSTIQRRWPRETKLGSVLKLLHALFLINGYLHFLALSESELLSYWFIHKLLGFSWYQSFSSLILLSLVLFSPWVFLFSLYFIASTRCYVTQLSDLLFHEVSQLLLFYELEILMNAYQQAVNKYTNNRFFHIIMLVTIMAKGVHIQVK